MALKEIIWETNNSGSSVAKCGKLSVGIITRSLSQKEVFYPSILNDKFRLKKQEYNNLDEAKQAFEKAFKEIVTGFFDIRPEVLKFALLMEQKLKKNDSKGGWKESEYDYLLQKVDEEFVQLKHHIRVKGTDGQIIGDCTDLANSAMMIADNTNGL